MYLGTRPWSRVVRAAADPSQYRALATIPLRFPDPWQMFRRYVLERGEYPYRCRVRTPTGVAAPTLFDSHDVLTMNEVFCRTDYGSDERLGVAVDIGANIGLASLYFLTRNATSRVYCYEPNPANAPRLLSNLAGYEDRFVFDEAAVTVDPGRVSFAVEPTGRYGHVGEGPGATITVEARAINDVLRTVIDAEGAIDVLKIDVEGIEEQLVAAIDRELLDAIQVVYYEAPYPAPFHLDTFDHRWRRNINRLVRRRTP